MDQAKEKSQWRNFYAHDRRLEPGFRRWLYQMGSRAFTEEEWEKVGPMVHDVIERRLDFQKKTGRQYVAGKDVFPMEEDENA